MKNKVRAICAFMIIAMAVAAATACSDSQVKQCADAAAKVSTTLGAMEQTVEQVQTDNLITPDEAITVANLISDATRVNDQFVAQVRTAKKLNDPTLASLTTAFQNVIDSVGKLQQQGVLHIKNPDAQAKLNLSLQAVQAALTIVRTFVSAVPTSGAPATRSFNDPRALGIVTRAAPQAALQTSAMREEAWRFALV